jgi:lipopolysaccharide export system permease protein
VVDPRETLPPKARPTLQLLREPSALNHGELVWRLGLVLAAGNMLLLGIGMSASNPRHASNWNLLFALFGFFAYYNFINLTQAWVSAGRLGLGAALLATHGTTLAMGIGLIWWREHGTSRVVMARRRVRRRPATAAPDAA